MTRQFETREAVRESVPLLVGLSGPSGSGKTYSALRLATGIQQVTGGDIAVIDTEARRALHYADYFKFQHMDFREPFGAVDYLEAMLHCHAQGAKVIVVDSMSHEHEGVGGLLDYQAQEHARLGGKEATKFLAWVKPKAARRKLINGALQIPGNFIFCFRAKATVKPVKRDNKTEFESQGFMPIAGDEFVYEQTVNILLPPASGGVPSWESEYAGEKTMMKLPTQFADLFAEPRPLDENIGIELAEWARGGEQPAQKAPPADDKANLLRDIKHEFVLNGISGQGKEEKAERKACFRDFFQADRWDVITGCSAQSLRKGLEEMRAHFNKGAA
jgi:hypothetical protein